MKLAQSSHNLLLAISVALMGLWCFAEIAGMWHAFPPDLSALYMAGYLFAEGRADLIYAAPEGFFGGMAQEWVPYRNALELRGESVLPYVYPPLWAAVLGQIAPLMSPQQFFQGAALILIPLLPVSAYLAWRIMPSNRLPLWAWFMVTAALLYTSLISKAAIVQLQPQIFVVFLMLLSFERYTSGKPGQAGAVLALAAALKLSPAGLALIFVLDRNWRALGWFVGIGAVLAAASFVFAGAALNFAFLERLSSVSNGVFISAINFSTEALLFAMAVEFGLAPDVSLTGLNIRIDDIPFWIGPLNTGLFMAFAVALIRATSPDNPYRLVLRFFGLSLLLNIFGPIGWAHYFLPQLLLLPALASILGLWLGLGWLAMFAAATSLWLFTVSYVQIGSSLPFVVWGVGILVLILARFMGARQPGTKNPLPAGQQGACA